MEKTVIIEPNRTLQNRILGIVFVLLAVINFLLYNGENNQWIYGSSHLIIGTLYLFYSFTGFSLTRRFSAKMISNSELLMIKTHFWKKTITIPWDQIKTIEMGSFQLVFWVGDEKKTLRYHTTSEQSIQLKRLIRSEADDRNIPVLGG